MTVQKIIIALFQFCSGHLADNSCVLVSRRYFQANDLTGIALCEREIRTEIVRDAQHQARICPSLAFRACAKTRRKSYAVIHDFDQQAASLRASARDANGSRFVRAMGMFYRIDQGLAYEQTHSGRL